MRSSYLILPTIAFADVPVIVPHHIQEIFPQHEIHFARLFDKRRLVLEEREHCGFHGCKLWRKAQDDTLLPAHLVFVIRITEEHQCCPIDANRRLDDVRHKAVAGFLIEVGQINAGMLLVLREIVIAAMMKAFEFSPTEGKLVFNVPCVLRVKYQILMLLPAQVLFPDAELLVIRHALLPPFLECLSGILRMDKILHFHLLKFAFAKEELARVDLIAECLPDLRDAKRELIKTGIEHVLIVDIDSLSRLSAKIYLRV